MRYPKTKCFYKYMVVDLSERNEEGYTAIIPKFPKLYIFVDTLEELHKVVCDSIQDEIKLYKKKGIPIPEPDWEDHKYKKDEHKEDKKYSGRLVLRMKPQIHQRLVDLAYAEGTSLNQYLNSLIEGKIGFKAK